MVLLQLKFTEDRDQTLKEGDIYIKKELTTTQFEQANKQDGSRLMSRLLPLIVFTQGSCSAHHITRATPAAPSRPRIDDDDM